jgi:hypothetical protein
MSRGKNARHDGAVRFMRGHDISWKKRNAVARASCSSLRRLAAGAKRKPAVAEMAGEPRGFGNEVAFFIEANEGWRLPSVELVAIGT